MALEPVLYSSDDTGALLLALFRQVEQGRNGEIGRGEVLTGIGLCPQNDLVVSSIAIGILQGQLRLTDASQATDGLWLGECRGLACMQGRRQLRKQFLTAREERIVWVGDIPDLIRNKGGRRGRDACRSV